MRMRQKTHTQRQKRIIEKRGGGGEKQLESRGNGDGLKDDMDKTHIEGKASEEIFNEEKVGGEVYDGTSGSGKIFNEANVSKEVSGETNVDEGILG